MKLLTALFSLVPLIAATPLSHNKRWDDVATKHSWATIPRGWAYHSTPPPDTKMNLRIGLKQQRLDELVDKLYDVSTPGSSNYGKHLTKEQVDELVAPHADTVDAVSSWLSYHGLSSSLVSNNPWVTLTLSVAEAEALLNTTYAVYHHPSSGERVLRTLSYALPVDLHDHVDVVAPTTYFGTMRSMRATHFIQPKPTSDVAEIEGLVVDATVPSSCARTITPSCLQALYQTANYTPSATSKNSLGIAGYLDEFANDADLQTFFSRFLPKAKGTTFQHVQVSGGGNNQSNPGVEANLDIQYTEGMSFPTPNIYYSTGGSPPFNPDSQTPTNTNEPYLDWLNFILNQTSIPQTFSTSYGDDEQTVPEDYATSVCNLFMQLGARGSSVMFSSGDFGVGGGDCDSNDGTNTVEFQPAFPASCPFVTTVGATTAINPETAASFSGGGFSRYFSTPAYQAAAVSKYLSSLGSTNSGKFNPNGRAYPDVSAQGENFQVIVGGSVVNVGGTSASSPTFAGVVALLNDFRLANNQPSLGFLNPLIYANPSGFNDITTGSNPGCRTNGFSAKTGWDPVTGLGTPNFVNLQAIVSGA